jgi:Arc/MetJ family transcription regulator
VVNLDDALVREAMKATGLTRKVDVVNEGLRVLVAQRRLERLFGQLRGGVAWEGDALEMRHGRRSR